jgi:hypothetical protein
VAADSSIAAMDSLRRSYFPSLASVDLCGLVASICYICIFCCICFICFGTCVLRVASNYFSLYCVMQWEEMTLSMLEAGKLYFISVQYPSPLNDPSLHKLQPPPKVFGWCSVDASYTSINRGYGHISLLLHYDAALLENFHNYDVQKARNQAKEEATRW